MSQERKKRSLCLVDLCLNEGVHLFPKDESRKALWLQAIVHFKPGRTLKNQSRICSAHFQPNDFVTTQLAVLQPDIAPKILKKSAIPSIFPWKNASPPPITSNDQNSQPQQDNHQESLAVNLSQIQKTYARTPPISFVEELNFNTMPQDIVKSEDPLKYCDIEETESDRQQCSEDVRNTDSEMVQLNTGAYLEVVLKEEIVCQENSMENMEYDEKYVKTENDSIITQKHDISTQTEAKFSQSIHYYKDSDKAIQFYTGFENFEKLMLVYQTLGQCVNKLNYFYETPPEKVDELDQFFITVLILRRHKPFDEIAIMFDITIHQVSNIFITWIRFMSLQWKNIDLWVDKDRVSAYTPSDFHDKFPSTRVILHVMECPIKKPKLTSAQQETFSMHKNRNTIKFFIGINPSGLICYVSPCYGGSATDRQIIERSSILDKFDTNDEVMVDKSLNVQDIFKPYGVKVIRKVASKSVESRIGLLKKYKILSQPLNDTQITLSSDIVFVCAMFVNFLSTDVKY